MYSFHGSSAAYAEFWNDSFWSTQQGKSRKISRRQIWQAFVHESLHTVAKVSDINLVLPDGLPIEEVTQNAFAKLGNDGIIRSAVEHSCSECTHVYKKVADVITGDDPAAMVGVDENRAVSLLLGDDADLAAQDAAQARHNAQYHPDEEIDVNEAPGYVTAIVMDGVVMGPTVSILILDKLLHILIIKHIALF